MMGLKKVVSLDPGVRTFVTAYSTDGQVVEWGPCDATRVSRLGAAYDKLCSKIKAHDVAHRRRYKMKRAALRIQAKIRHIVDELHHKTVKRLCSNFRVVLFETQQMVTAKFRIQNSSSNVLMVSLSLQNVSSRQGKRVPMVQGDRHRGEAYYFRLVGGADMLTGQLGAKRSTNEKVVGLKWIVTTTEQGMF